MSEAGEPSHDTDPLEGAAPGALGDLPRRTLTIALSILPIVALGNVAVLVYSLGGIHIGEKVKQPGMLLLVAALVFVPMLANSLRLAIWARFLDVRLGFRRSLKVISGTMVANSVTPSATGGMPIKLLFLMGEGVDSRRSVSLISFQTAEDTFLLVGMLLGCLGISGFALLEFFSSDPELLAKFDASLRITSMVVLWILVTLAVLALVIAAGLLGDRVRDWASNFSRKVKGWIRQIGEDWMAVFRRGKGIALINLGFAALQWIVRFSIAGLVLAAFGVEWQPALFWLLQYLVQSISSIVPTPGGAGGAEAAFLLLFAPFVAMGVLVPAMSTWRLLHFYLPLVGAALTFFVLHRADRAKAVSRQRSARTADEGPLPQPAE